MWVIVPDEGCPPQEKQQRKSFGQMLKTTSVNVFLTSDLLQSSLSIKGGIIMAQLQNL